MKAAKALLEKYKAGTCTAEEIKLIDKWLLEIHAGEESDLEFADFEQIRKELWGNIEQQTKKRKAVKLWPRIAVAAAAISAIAFGIWLFSTQYMNGRPEFISGSQYTNDVAPGRNTAIITLENGETITLSDAKTGVVIGNDKLAYNDGSTVANSSPSGRDGVAREGSKVQMLTASTPRGGTYQVTLSDGTRVWLNADSKISFPMQFSGATRKILLSGEAYFEVATAYTSSAGTSARSLSASSSSSGTSLSLRERRTKQSFIVESEGQEVEVLGTHFNISAYRGEELVKTTLIEGSVKVSSMQQQMILVPGSEAVKSASGIKVHNVDAALAIAWKNNKFVFENEKIQTIMKMVERWYDVQVIYEGEMPEDVFGGSVSRFDNVSQVLKILESTGRIHFKIEGRKIYVSR